MSNLEQENAELRRQLAEADAALTAAIQEVGTWSRKAGLLEAQLEKAREVRNRIVQYGLSAFTEERVVAELDTALSPAPSPEEKAAKAKEKPKPEVCFNCAGTGNMNEPPYGQCRGCGGTGTKPEAKEKTHG